MTHSGVPSIDSYQLTTHNGFLKFDSNRLMTQKASRILIQINSWLKKSFRILHRINSWHSDAIHSQFHVTFFRPSAQLLTWWPFCAFHSKVDFVWPFLGFSTQSAFLKIDSNHFMTLKQYLGDLNRFNSWLKRLSRNWLRINSWLEWIPRYWFRSTHDSKFFPILRFTSAHDSSKITFDSESTHDFTLSHTDVLTRANQNGCELKL